MYTSAIYRLWIFCLL